MKAFFAVIGIALLAVVLVLVMAALLAYPIMLLWNGLLPELFGFKVITFWQAMGLCVLIHLLFPGSSGSSSK